MRAVITGVAGFIGSTLAQRLLDRGDEILGIDNFTHYYDPAVKRGNVARLAERGGFRLVEADLTLVGLEDLLRGVDVVFHLAGQPGVRGSWAKGFNPYCDANIIATQRVLECARRVRVARVVYASSSSVYGNAQQYPCKESDAPAPYSPYGVTKLAGEHLCRLYSANYNLSTVSLRYFTVFGPRQRPEMAMSQLISAAATHRPFTLFAAPGTVRDFTFVEDVAIATAAAGIADVAPGTVLNISGGAPASMSMVIGTLEDLLGESIDIRVAAPKPGDVVRTGGDSRLAHILLEWAPTVTLRDGLAAQLEWYRSTRQAVLSVDEVERTPVRWA